MKLPCERSLRADGPGTGCFSGRRLGARPGVTVAVGASLVGFGSALAGAAMARNPSPENRAPSGVADSGTAGRAVGSEFAAYSRRVFGDLRGLPLSVFEPVGAAHMRERARRVSVLCEMVDTEYRTLGWGESPCNALPWNFDRLSERGMPLIYAEFNGLPPGSNAIGRPGAQDETTLVLGGVHPDELTPVHLAFRFAEELSRDPTLYADRRVIIAPLVNPDGFFVHPQTRTNASGIDLNRNFATTDWWVSAGRIWRARRKADPRHFPGHAPATEEGTRFQVDLLQRYDVDKLITVHAPLGFLDYDGPGDNKKLAMLSPSERRARELATLVSRTSNNYRLKDFVFYPGSLGNYAGNERFIPTVTLELQSSNPKLSRKFWNDFYPSLVAAVKYDFVKSALAKAEFATREKNR